MNPDTHAMNIKTPFPFVTHDTITELPGLLKKKRIEQSVTQRKSVTSLFLCLIKLHINKGLNMDAVTSSVLSDAA